MTYYKVYLDNDAHLIRGSSREQKKPPRPGGQSFGNFSLTYFYEEISTLIDEGHRVKVLQMRAKAHHANGRIFNVNLS
jgi:hypothetical protein